MSIQGKIVVFTGEISIPRAQAWTLVEINGGIVGKDITKKTDYLIVGKDSGSKLIKAAALGIQTLTEEEWRVLLKPKEDTGEVPLTKEELEEIEKHTLIKTCKWCNSSYKIWDNLKDKETCPVCGILSDPPHCPHCDNNVTYVTDFNLYTCSLCGTWFSASYSIRANRVEHLHFFINKDMENPLRKVCAGCNASITITEADKSYRDLKYINSPEWIKEWRIRNKELEEKFSKERAALDFVKSLSEEQVEALNEGKRIP